MARTLSSPGGFAFDEPDVTEPLVLPPRSRGMFFAQALRRGEPLWHAARCAHGSNGRSTLCRRQKKVGRHDLSPFTRNTSADGCVLASSKLSVRRADLFAGESAAARAVEAAAHQ